MEIKSRTLIIVAIFFGVALVATVFIFLYRAGTDSMIKAYIAKITTCANITDERDCFSREYCQGIYDSQQVFVGCQNVSTQARQINEAYQRLCAKTGGQWHKNMYGESCICLSGRFDSTQGCINR